jgi:hypothetical protein
MAFIKDFNEENQQQGQQLSGSSGTVSSTPTGGGAAQPAGNAGSGWTNLQTYLGANKGEAGGLANQIGQNANQKVDEFKGTKVDSAVSEINKASGTDQVNDYTQDIVKNADKAKSFLGSGYGGKSTDVYTAGIRNQANQVKDELGQLTNQGYQKSTLQKLNNKPNQTYSSGFGALDSFLVNADPNARAKLTMTQGRAGEVDQTLGGLTGQITEADKAARAQFDANKGRIRDATRNQYNTTMGNVQTRLGEAKNQQGQQFRDQAGNLLTSGIAGNEFISGISAQDANPFVKENAAFGAGDVASDAEIEALNTLAGIDSNLGLKGLQKSHNKAFTIDNEGIQGLIRQKEAEGKAKRQAEIDAENARLQKQIDEANARKAQEEALRQTNETIAAQEAARSQVPDLVSNPPPSANVPTYQPGQVAIDTAGNTPAQPVVNWIPFFDEFLTPEAAYIPTAGQPILTF